jgi:hypothetical protein
MPDKRQDQRGERMNEETWLTTPDVEAMLVRAPIVWDDRQRRLFACACCRRLWSILTREQYRSAVETAERYADGRASTNELRRVTWTRERVRAIRGTKRGDALWAVTLAASVHWRFQQEQQVARLARFALGCPRNNTMSERVREELAAQCALLRDIAGNPYRRVELDPAWLQWNNGTVRKVAEAIYEDAAFSELPVLADALEEAGCSEPVLLEHCRSAGPHVRGCWALDLLAGKR